MKYAEYPGEMNDLTAAKEARPLLVSRVQGLEETLQELLKSCSDMQERLSAAEMTIASLSHEVGRAT